MSFFKSKNSSKTSSWTVKDSSKKKKGFWTKLLGNVWLPIYPVYTNKAPQPVGPYSQAMRVHLGYAGSGLMFLSGQIALDPDSSQPVGEDISEQSRQVLENIKAVLKSQKLGFSSVIKTLVFLTDMEDFESFNAVYEEYFKDHKPARSCVEVSKLPKGMKVEVEVIAYK